MISLQEILTHGAGNAWLFIPTAIFLGALHGLEPGHSKTMMAAFIVAIRGTIAQAVLLGLSAAFSHSLVIWLLALGGLHFGARWNVETTEPYFQMVSGLIILGLAVWMFFRARRDARAAEDHHHHHRHHEPEGPHGGQLIEIKEGFIEVSVFEEGVPPRFRLYCLDSEKRPTSLLNPDEVKLETERETGTRQIFVFRSSGSFLDAMAELPEPHEFKGVLTIGDKKQLSHTFEFHEHHHHHGGLNVGVEEYQDAHEKAHAMDIAKRFTDRNVTTGQVVLFGLTGGLLPCPAALTVLLVCLQLKKFSLGFALVLSFSFGLAVTLVATGVIAAWGVRHASKHFKGFGTWIRRAPYFSSVILICLGLYIAIQGWLHLT